MPLLLDPRHRAMLREMGVHVWQPEGHADPAAARQGSPAASLPVATKSGATHTRPERAVGLKGADFAADSAADLGSLDPVVAAPLARRPVVPAPLAAPLALPARLSAPATAPAARVGAVGPGSPVWQQGERHTLYGAEAAGVKTSPAHWLVLVETPAASLQAGGFDPLAGEAGALLGNMLRAARLPAAAQVLLVPLARLLPSSPAQAGLADALAPLLADIRPDMVLLMGRLAAQAALKTDEPLGQLRGRIHRLHGIATVLTYDPAHLLRNADNKAKAWDDLCLAMGFVEGLGLVMRG